MDKGYSVILGISEIEYEITKREEISSLIRAEYLLDGVRMVILFHVGNGLLNDPEINFDEVVRYCIESFNGIE